MFRRPYNPTAYDDDWEDQPGQGPWYQYGAGLIVAAMLILYGVRAIVTQHATLGSRQSVELTGLNATAYGIAWASAGVFVHCHYFWGNIYNQAWFAVLGKILAAIGFIAGLGVVLVRNGILGIH